METFIVVILVLFVVGSALQYLDLWMHRQMSQFGPFALLICLAAVAMLAMGAFR